MSSLQTIQKSSQELWKDYLFLTTEMLSFLNNQDMDVFYELMKQREVLQAMIEELQGDEFRLSALGKQLIMQIQKTNENMILKLQYVVNNSRNQHDVSRAYDGVGTSLTGNRMDRQT